MISAPYRDDIEAMAEPASEDIEALILVVRVITASIDALFSLGSMYRLYRPVQRSHEDHHIAEYTSNAICEAKLLASMNISGIGDIAIRDIIDIFLIPYFCIYVGHI